MEFPNNTKSFVACLMSHSAVVAWEARRETLYFGLPQEYVRNDKNAPPLLTKPVIFLAYSFNMIAS